MQAALPATIPDSKTDQINKYMAKARKMVRMQIKLAAEPATEAQSVSVLMNSRACQMKGERTDTEHKSFVGIILDTKRLGEATSAPNLRVPSIKDGRLAKLFSVILQARDSTRELQAGDAFFLFDGMKHNNETLFLNSFKGADGTAISKTKRTISLVYSESSLSSRLRCVKGYAAMHQIENLHIISKEPIKTKTVNRLHYEGTSRGQVIAPVTAPSWDDPDQWTLTPAEKRTMFGKIGRIAVGGSAGIRDDSDNKPARRDPNAPEPVFFHAHPYELDEELTHNFPMTSIIDLTGASPNLCMIALRKRIPYFGFCFTDDHVNKLQQEVERITFKAMKTEGDTLHEPGLCELLKGGGDEDNEEGEEEEDAEGDQEEPGDEEEDNDEDDAQEEAAEAKKGKTVKSKAKAKANVKAKGGKGDMDSLKKKLEKLYKKSKGAEEE